MNDLGPSQGHKSGQRRAGLSKPCVWYKSSSRPRDPWAVFIFVVTMVKHMSSEGLKTKSGAPLQSGRGLGIGQDDFEAGHPKEYGQRSTGFNHSLIQSTCELVFQGTVLRARDRAMTMTACL